MFSAMMPFIVCMSSTSACTPLSERPSCGQGYADCVPICDYSSIAPLVQEFCPAQLKLHVRAGITGTASRVKRRYKGLSNFAAVRTSSRAVWQSAGITAVMLGIVESMPISSMHWWLVPLFAGIAPPCEQAILTFGCG